MLLDDKKSRRLIINRLKNEDRKMEKVRSVQNICITNAIRAVAFLAAMVTVTGCGPLMGVKHGNYLWGVADIDYTDGTDFHAGVNSIDHVDDRRGVGGKNKRSSTSKAPAPSAEVDEDSGDDDESRY